MFGLSQLEKDDGGRKWKAFVLLYVGTILMAVLHIFDGQQTLSSFLILSGIYSGSNVLQKGVLKWMEKRNEKT